MVLQGFQGGLHIFEVAHLTAEVEHAIDVPRDQALVFCFDQGCKQPQVLHLFGRQAVLLPESGQSAVGVEQVAVVVGIEELAVSQ